MSQVINNDNQSQGKLLLSVSCFILQSYLYSSSQSNGCISSTNYRWPVFAGPVKDTMSVELAEQQILVLPHSPDK